MTTSYCRHSPSLQNGKRVAFLAFIGNIPLSLCNSTGIAQPRAEGLLTLSFLQSVAMKK